MDVLNRCTIGVRLPQELQQQLVQIQGTIRHKAGQDVVRWLPPHELILPIIALGEMSIQNMQNIRRTIPTVTRNYPVLKLCVEGLIGIPSNLQPRFVGCGITGDLESLTRMHRELEAQVLPYLRGYEAKPFHPQINLGRIKIESEQSRTTLGRAIKMAAVGQVGQLHVDSIDLLLNATGPTGPVYTVVEMFALQT